jgi:hypothetical protein
MEGMKERWEQTEGREHKDQNGTGGRTVRAENKPKDCKLERKAEKYAIDKVVDGRAPKCVAGGELHGFTVEKKCRWTR